MAVQNKKKKTKKIIGNNQATRCKLSGLPFEKATDLKRASDELRQKVWERLEVARIFNEMSKKDDYKFIQEEFKAGLKCKYGNSAEYLVKVFSDGVGVQVDINKDLVKDIPHSTAFVETLIRSMGDTFSKSYYQAKGIIPTGEFDIGDIIKNIQKVVAK